MITHRHWMKFIQRIVDTFLTLVTSVYFYESKYFILRSICLFQGCPKGAKSAVHLASSFLYSNICSGNRKSECMDIRQHARLGNKVV